jgi:uncharacterized membrane protein YeaQ/YmgE (transglycosylase-associated protein family)
MNILWAIVIGFLAGAIAKFIMPGRDPGGFVITALLGIGGSLLATWVGQAAGWYQQGQGAGFIAAIVGAIVLLAIYHFVRSAFGGGYHGTTARRGGMGPVT